ETNGLGNSITTNNDATGNKVSETWVHSDGTSGADRVSSQDYNGTSNSGQLQSELLAMGANSSPSGQVNWSSPDGSSGWYESYVGGQSSFLRGYASYAESFFESTSANDDQEVWLNTDGSVGLVYTDSAYTISPSSANSPAAVSQIFADGYTAPNGGDYEIDDAVNGVHFDGYFDSTATGAEKTLNGWSGPVENINQSAPVTGTPMTMTVAGTNGDYGVLTDDGQGNIMEVGYNAQGVKLDDIWLHDDGSSGYDFFNADGSSKGITFYENGTTLAYTNDGHGHIAVTNYPGANANVWDYVPPPLTSEP